MDTRRTGRKKLDPPPEAPGLNLLSPEAGDADLAHPDGQIRDRADFIDLGRPIIQLPEIPIEWKAVHGHDIHMVEQAFALHVPDELRVDRRNPSQNLGK